MKLSKLFLFQERSLASLVFLLAIFHSVELLSNWGTGYYGAAMPCPYEIRNGDNSTKESDEIDLLRNTKSEIQSQINELKRLLNDANRNIKNNREAFNSKFYPKESNFGEFANDYENHTECANNNSAYFSSLCKTLGEKNLHKLCEEPQISNNPCKEAVNRWKKSIDQRDTIQSQIDDLTNQKVVVEDDIFSRQSEKRERDFEDRLNRARGISPRTEASCTNCAVASRSNPREAENKETDWNLIGSIFGSVLGAYTASSYDYKKYKTAVDSRAKLGLATQYVPTSYYAMGPLLTAVNGLLTYGAYSSGTAQGTWGCSSGPNGSGTPYGQHGLLNPFAMSPYYNVQGSPLGYPQNYYPGYPGGLMYNNGIGPWGASGPGSLGYCYMAPCPGTGAGYPGYGASFQFGNPYAGAYGIPGYGGGYGGAGVPGYGGYPGSQFGSPFPGSGGYGGGPYPGYGYPGYGYPGSGVPGYGASVQFGNPFAGAGYGGAGIPGYGGYPGSQFGSPFPGSGGYGAGPYPGYGYPGFGSPGYGGNLQFGSPYPGGYGYPGTYPGIGSSFPGYGSPYPGLGNNYNPMMMQYQQQMQQQMYMNAMNMEMQRRQFLSGQTQILQGLYNEVNVAMSKIQMIQMQIQSSGTGAYDPYSGMMGAYLGGGYSFGYPGLNMNFSGSLGFGAGSYYPPNYYPQNTTRPGSTGGNNPSAAPR